MLKKILRSELRECLSRDSCDHTQCTKLLVPNGEDGVEGQDRLHGHPLPISKAVAYSVLLIPPVSSYYQLLFLTEKIHAAFRLLNSPVHGYGLTVFPGEIAFKFCI